MLKMTYSPVVCIWYLRITLVVIHWLIFCWTCVRAFSSLAGTEIILTFFSIALILYIASVIIPFILHYISYLLNIYILDSGCWLWISFCFLNFRNFFDVLKLIGGTHQGWVAGGSFSIGSYTMSNMVNFIHRKFITWACPGLLLY